MTLKKYLRAWKIPVISPWASSGSGVTGLRCSLSTKTPEALEAPGSRATDTIQVCLPSVPVSLGGAVGGRWGDVCALPGG